MPNVEANEGMKVTDVMPALGTHAPMTEEQCKTMFGEEMCSSDIFRVHDWRNDVVTIGHAPPSMVSAATQGMVSKPWPAQLNKLVWEGRHDLVFSIGQVVPHEVMGMANYNKNLFVGVGGLDAINLSHFIGAVYGMENMMGKASNPLKDILNYASENFLENKLPLFYILTVMGTNADSGELEMKGLFFGNDIKCYLAACELSLSVNFTMLEEAPMKVVVHLDEDEFHSTWLGNKAIYRTRMAIATGGELIVLGPGVKRFGEDDGCDILIRKYGYVGTPKIMELMRENEDLQNNLSVVAHLIHGSSEGRFDITYCPGALSQVEVEKAGFKYADLDEMTAKYGHLKDGWGEVDGEKVFYISNPALGLWAHESRFEKGGNGREGSGGGEVPVGENQVGVGGSGGVGGNRG
ncbi:hypothetical protein TrVE_jg10669 [Triparma verrucosa]|uniref:LarA-like N-terminal domain-containing protein n=1 Tax=Triparma verrucosa TaxID=1606542 RepID=A0A9W7F742_9STRA|nr:hypothetical protein TrVE_jg10669 [Triparma verrucosa]